ncbi:MAG: hypothetical protein AAGU32_19530, partial [Bacillota bacterium]
GLLQYRQAASGVYRHKIRCGGDYVLCTLSHTKKEARRKEADSLKRPVLTAYSSLAKNLQTFGMPVFLFRQRKIWPREEPFSILILGVYNQARF